MYLAKTEKFLTINQRKVAEIVGITESTMSKVVNRKQGCSKMTAFAIVKTIHPLAEIEEYFDKKGE